MRALLLVSLALAGCKREAPPVVVSVPAAPVVPAPGLTPSELTVEGAYHAVACGAVTAVWSGSAEGLKALPQPAPKTYGVESLAFKFADGSTKHFVPAGQLFFSDWRFEVFAPDCSRVVLLMDRFGPYHVVKTDELRGYLEGRVKPLVVQALDAKEALVHGDAFWPSKDALEFTASCCGGAQVFRAALTDGSLTRVFEAAQAPHGLKRTAKGYEVVAAPPSK